jgi:hypothetical protein
MIQRTKALIRETHGDYDRMTAMMLKRGVIGKSTITFKTWVSRLLYERFGSEQDDILSELDVNKETGVGVSKGRYRSITPLSIGIASGGIMAAFASLPIALIVGAGVGLGRSVFFENNFHMGVVQELIVTSKILLRKIVYAPIKGPINYVNLRLGNKQPVLTSMVGKEDELFKKVAKESGEKYSEADVGNFMANLQEMANIALILISIIFAKITLWDDDDDDENPRRRMHNAVINRAMMLLSEIYMYNIPMAFSNKESWNQTTQPAILGWATSWFDMLTSLGDVLKGEDMYISGPHSGESKFYRNFNKVFMPAVFKGITDIQIEGIFHWESVLGLRSQTKQQFQNTAFDKMFWGDPKKEKEEATRERVRFKKMLMDEHGYTKDDAEKAAEETYGNDAETIKEIRKYWK